MIPLSIAISAILICSGLALFVGICIGSLIGLKPHRLPSSAYFLQRPDVVPVMSRWNADAVRSAREVH